VLEEEDLEEEEEISEGPSALAPVHIGGAKAALQSWRSTASTSASPSPLPLPPLVVDRRMRRRGCEHTSRR
jgi:hypothetical protein